MLANYEEHGFKITAKVMPDTCTSCPFWCLNLENCEKEYAVLREQKL